MKTHESDIAQKIKGECAAFSYQLPNLFCCSLKRTVPEPLVLLRLHYVAITQHEILTAKPLDGNFQPLYLATSQCRNGVWKIHWLVKRSAHVSMKIFYKVVFLFFVEKSFALNFQIGPIMECWGLKTGLFILKWKIPLSFYTNGNAKSLLKCIYRSEYHFLFTLLNRLHHHLYLTSVILFAVWQFFHTRNLLMIYNQRSQLEKSLWSTE